MSHTPAVPRPQWVLVASPFGYPMYVADDGLGYSDRREDATLYDDRDSQSTKARYFKAATGFDFQPAAA